MSARMLPTLLMVLVGHAVNAQALSPFGDVPARVDIELGEQVAACGRSTSQNLVLNLLRVAMSGCQFDLTHSTNEWLVQGDNAQRLAALVVAEGPQERSAGRRLGELAESDRQDGAAVIHETELTLSRRSVTQVWVAQFENRGRESLMVGDAPMARAYDDVYEVTYEPARAVAALQDKTQVVTHRLIDCFEPLPTHGPAFDVLYAAPWTPINGGSHSWLVSLPGYDLRLELVRVGSPSTLYLIATYLYRPSASEASSIRIWIAVGFASSETRQFVPREITKASFRGSAIVIDRLTFGNMQYHNDASVVRLTLAPDTAAWDVRGGVRLWLGTDAKRWPQQIWRFAQK